MYSVQGNTRESIIKHELFIKVLAKGWRCSKISPRFDMVLGSPYGNFLSAFNSARKANSTAFNLK